MSLAGNPLYFVQQDNFTPTTQCVFSAKLATEGFSAIETRCHCKRLTTPLPSDGKSLFGLQTFQPDHEGKSLGQYLA